MRACPRPDAHGRGNPRAQLEADATCGARNLLSTTHERPYCKGEGGPPAMIAFYTRKKGVRRDNRRTVFAPGIGVAALRWWSWSGNRGSPTIFVRSGRRQARPPSGPSSSRGASTATARSLAPWPMASCRTSGLFREPASRCSGTYSPPFCRLASRAVSERNRHLNQLRMLLGGSTGAPLAFQV